ncbi:amidase family protein [uncultured Cohaesibacter sp.]|uniref:amidase family protein n=1 Tax=uncultured Cohaesibacter sp. TaxID=1002546 RepID=UPI0029C67415|nr:amidase family protein [uncultured Cohaesibacter sp.]
MSAFALTVEDAYRVHQVASAFDEADAYSRLIDAPSLFAIKTPLTIGIPDSASIKFFGDDAQAASFAEGVALLEAAGHTIEPVDFSPFYAIAEMLYEGAWVAERNSVIEKLMASDPEAILPVTRKIVGKANDLSATDAFRGFYRLKELSRKVEPLLKRLDLLCVPTIRPSTRSPIWKPIRSRQTPTSVPTPISSTCSTCADWPCRSRHERTDAPAASPCWPHPARMPCLPPCPPVSNRPETARSARQAGPDPKERPCPISLPVISSWPSAERI